MDDRKCTQWTWSQCLNIRGSHQKMSKTKIVQKDVYIRPSKAKGFCTKPQKVVLLLYFDSFSPPNAKRSRINKNISQSKFSVFNL